MPKSWEHPPSSPHWQLQLGEWKGLGWAVERGWELRAGSVLKALLFGKSCKQGISSEVQSSPCLLFACSFFSQISWMIHSPRGTVVKALVHHVAISKYPDVWYQGRKEKIAIWQTEFVTILPNVLVSLRQWLQSLVPKYHGCSLLF